LPKDWNQDWLTSQSTALPATVSPSKACGQLRIAGCHAWGNIIDMDGWTCAHCGLDIGVYEPIVIVEDERERQTSRLAERHARGVPYHASCRPSAGQGAS
jgi:hypothetical protein